MLNELVLFRIPFYFKKDSEQRLFLMIQNPEISRHNFIFKLRKVRDIDCVSLISYDDDGPLQDHISPKSDVS